MADPKDQGGFFEAPTFIVRDDEATLIGDPSVPGTPDPDPAAAATPPASSEPVASGKGTLVTGQLQSELIGGRFRIIALLGSGGMGNVYKVTDTELDETVALKMLRREAVGTPEMLERFRQEVKLARRVTHPNVARTFDIGEHENEKFLTMELVEGESLSARMRRLKQLSLGETIEVGLPICAGLTAAHAAGVVHRDLKPENVLISREGRVVITDFGIARQTADAGGAEQTSGLLIGTPTYMAPEQVRHGTIDRRTDLYALGAMFYEMLTGHKAWTGGTTIAVAVARLLAPPPDPRAHRPELIDAAAQLVLSLMALDPKDRPASAEDVAQALAGLPVGGTTRRALSVPVTTTSTLTRIPAPSSEATSRPGLPGGSLAESSPGDHGLAVLPFRNAGDPADDHWADGFTDDLIETLSLLPKLKVRSRGAVLKFRGPALDPREVGRELDVQAVVEGSVRRTPSLLRVTTRLVSVSDGFQLWARRFDRPDGDLLSIADEVAQAIAEALVKPIALPARSDLNDPVALDLYLRARKLLRVFHREGAIAATELIEQALARVPDDPRLLSAQAIARARVWVLEGDGNRSYEIAMAAAARAKQLAPESAEAHTATAVMLLTEMRVLDAAPELRMALKRGPMLAEPRELAGRLLIELDRIDDGMAELERALALEPGLITCEVEMARGHALKGNWDRTWELVTGDTFGQVTARARFLLWSDRLEETMALVDREEKRYPQMARFRVLTTEGPPRAQTMVGPRRARRDLFFLQLGTELAAASHEPEIAMGSFSRAVDSGLFDLSWVDRCPILAGLRKDPRFGPLRQRVVTRSQAILGVLLG